MRASRCSASAPRACRPALRIRIATPACRSRRCATPRRCRRARARAASSPSGSPSLRGRARPCCGQSGQAHAPAPRRGIADLSRARRARVRAHRDAHRCPRVRPHPSRPRRRKRALRPTAASRARSTASSTSKAKDLTLLYEGKRCIHSRFCVTGAPKVFLANVKGPWIHPDRDARRSAWSRSPTRVRRARSAIAARTAMPDEQRAAGQSPADARERPVRACAANMLLDGQPIGYRATLCRCGASKNKPFCDGSHHDVGFTATGEPATGKTDMLEVRDGPLAIDPRARRPAARCAATSRSSAARAASSPACRTRACAAAATATTSRSATTATCAWDSRARRGLRVDSLVGLHSSSSASCSRLRARTRANRRTQRRISGSMSGLARERDQSAISIPRSRDVTKRRNTSLMGKLPRAGRLRRIRSAFRDA